MAKLIVIISSLLPHLLFFFMLLFQPSSFRSAGNNILNIENFFQPSSFRSAANNILNIENFGAIGDGKTDARQAMLAAWSAACNSSSTDDTTILVPAKTYFLSSIVLRGPCKSSSKKITFQLEGSTLVAPNYKQMGPSSDYWVRFDSVQGVSLIGGNLDGRGTSLWACKSGGTQCPAGASSLGFLGSKDILVRNLRSTNAKLYHIVFLQNRNVTVEGVNINAPGDSPNTDGIHVQNSIQVRVQDTHIMTGDDCISIGPGTQDLRMLRVNCGPGHGISIGSLGKDKEEEGVEGVVVYNSTFSGSTNGVRIKSWARPSNGFVRGVTFQKIIMDNVKNPIIIDQNYCPHNIGCPGQSSGIQVRNITYKDIKGTSATQVAMNFNCSVTTPCQEITLEDINLSYGPAGSRPAQSFCKNANGIVRGGGAIIPPSCLI